MGKGSVQNSKSSLGLIQITKPKDIITIPACSDYFGLPAHPDESFRVLWSDSRSGVLQLWMAPVRVYNPGKDD